MRSPEIVALVAGALAAGFAICGLFLLRFWSRTREALFLVFALAFWLLAANQVAPVLLGIPRENASGVYLFRLAAFVLIIAGILGKNFFGRRR